MSSKKDELLKKAVEEYPLNDEERNELASLIALVNQATMAQDLLYTRIVNTAAQRLEISDKELSLNMEQIGKEGIKAAKLVVS